MNIRESLFSDLESIRNLHLEAFGEGKSEEISKLSLVLAGDSSSNLSLIAVKEGAVIRHVVFSPINISNSDNLSCFILVPLAVSPSEQKS